MIERFRVRIPAEAAREISAPESTLCADPGHSAKRSGGRLHLNTQTPSPLTNRSRSGLTIPLSRQSVGIYQETSSHATRQGMLGHSRLSLLSHCGLILA